MVKKKRVKKKSVAKVVNKNVHSSQDNVARYSRRINIAFKNFLLFALLGVVSYLLFSVSSEAIFVNLFEILSMLFGFVALALIISVLVFSLLKWFSR
jgi:hypothetical protein